MIFSRKKSTKHTVLKSETTLNGKKYREVTKYTIYCLSKTIRSTGNYLVDRKANGGAACNYVRVIVKRPGITVDTRGVDNHEITFIPLATADRFTSTTEGENFNHASTCMSCKE